MWKNYGINNELPRFIEKIKDHRIVVVGPSIFKDFDERAGFSNYRHIPIDYRRASEKAFEIHDEILKTSEPNTVYFFVAGALGTWLVTKLHKHLKDVFMFDVGRGLHYYYPKTSYAWLRYIKKSGAEAN